METPWQPVAPIEPETFESVRRRAIFDCCKWDPQVEDVSTLLPAPILLGGAVWRRLETWAETLAAETAAIERVLLGRLDLQRRLGLPRPVLKGLAANPVSEAPDVRVIRFDFHFTTEGWRISEANTDVPGGFNEASGYSSLIAEHYPGSDAAGDPAGSLARAMARLIKDGPVALIHATAFADDRQVMVYLSRRLAALGVSSALAGPDHLRWKECHAQWARHGDAAAPGFVFRFYPAEWLPNLPSACGWRNLLGSSLTPLCNPGSALLTQSKRLPLVWDQLGVRLDAWKELLPECADPRQRRWEESPNDWVLKPALGRVGDMIGMSGVSSGKEWQAICNAARRRPEEWVAQRRFEAVPMESPLGPLYPCIGVYTIDGKAAGAYGRVARQPLINHQAADAAVLVANSSTRAEAPSDVRPGRSRLERAEELPPAAVRR